MNVQEAIKTSGFKNEKQKAAINIMYTAYEVKSRISRVLKDYGITPEQYNVLRILKGKYPDQMCVKDVAQRMIERSSNVPRIVDRLEAKKLVKRSQSGSDRRETVMVLTQAGIDLLESLNPVLEASHENISTMNETELGQLNSLLDRYLKD
jgi:DNA-binding MarR family transcriptional regulator